LHPIDYHLLGCNGDSHQARGALPIYRLTRDGIRQTACERCQAPKVQTRRSCWQSGTHHYIVDLGSVYSSA
jgi:hypothetical protein